MKAQLDERDQQLSTLQKQAKGNEELQSAIKQLQEDNKKTAEEYQQKLDQQAFDFAVETALRDAKSKNIKAVKANLNLDSLKLADGKVIGLEEQLNALKDSDSYLLRRVRNNRQSLQEDNLIHQIDLECRQTPIRSKKKHLILRNRGVYSERIQS
ncbi:phage scaffolding protein [Bacillus stercoris]|nr:phage scaffolding protein [Bacillus stercoris]